ncbi:MAG: nucleotide exchange factor GrpE [Rickettsiales bacterium]|jgi:molecular chaperone GrpE|nr:nucleotide exchange factor GrpE [Rickettsiales bacterium]
MTEPAKPQAANENMETVAASNDQVDAQASPDLAEQLNAMRDQWLRAVAETENVRKRAERDREETSKYAVSAFARDMVSVLENLKRASESIPAELRASDEKLKTLGEGVDLTLQELLSIFERYKIKRIDPMGEKFDHHFHQAVVQVERPDIPAGTVIQVVQAGYIIHDRLLRPAMVAVSKQGEPTKQVDTNA